MVQRAYPVFAVASVSAGSALDNLVGIDTTPLSSGVRAWVIPTSSLYVLDVDSTAAADGVNVVAPTTGPGRWFLLASSGSAQYLQQPTWFINANTGNDSNDGATSLTALASWAELARRWGPSPILRQTTDVFIESSLTEILSVQGGVVSLTGTSLLRIHGGVSAQLASGTFSGVTPLNVAAQQRLVLSDTGLGSQVKQRIRVTTGAAAGAIAWGAEQLGADDLACSPAGIFDTSAVPLPGSATLATPAGGDDYVVESLFQVDGIDLSVSRADESDGATFALLVEDLAITGDTILQLDSAMGPGGVLPVAVGCQLGDGAFALTGEAYFCCLCFVDVFNVVGTGRATSDACLFFSSFTVFVVIGGGLFLRGQTLFESTVLIVALDGILGGLTTSPGAVFNSPNDGLRLLRGSKAVLNGVLWGTGNGDVGIEVEPAALYAYPAAQKPTVTGTTGDTRVGGVVRAYGLIPIFNPTGTDASGIVQQ